MSAQPKANEPSMEEILASIRKIIADDQTKPPTTTVAEPPAPQPHAVPEPVQAPVQARIPAPQVDDDILDLGMEAKPAAARPVEAKPAPAEDIDLLFEPPAAPENLVREPTIPQHAPAMLDAPGLDMSGLLSNQASSSVSSAFGSLAHTVLSQNARTVDDLVKEMLKPLLKGWLDDNLPTMVERLVRAEIERVARGGR